jgi:hypothetical protein
LWPPTSTVTGRVSMTRPGPPVKDQATLTPSASSSAFNPPPLVPVTPGHVPLVVVVIPESSSFTSRFAPLSSIEFSTSSKLTFSDSLAAGTWIVQVKNSTVVSTVHSEPTDMWESRVCSPTSRKSNVHALTLGLSSLNSLLLDLHPFHFSVVLASTEPDVASLPSDRIISFPSLLAHSRVAPPPSSTTLPDFMAPVAFPELDAKPSNSSHYPDFVTRVPAQKFPSFFS